MERKREERKRDNSLTIKSVYCEAVEAFTDAGLDEVTGQAKILMEHCFGVTAMDYILNPNKELETKSYEEFCKLVEKRCKKIPLQHIIGTANFMGMEFIVNENVLIPRFDTENLVEKVLRECEGKKVLDMCTGSGCIILALAKLGRIESGTGVDISEKALEVAKKNKERLNCANVTFVNSDLFSELDTSERFDIVVSNPPYIATKEIETLMDEVKCHDPFIALDGKEDGLHFYRLISKQARAYLVEGGLLALEIGYDQLESVSEILRKDGYRHIEGFKDLSGLDRVLIARR